MLNVNSNMKFYKYHGNGNDFIMIDNRIDNFDLSASQINKLCDRHMGIGADGLILLAESDRYDFEMVYFNSDGRLGSMCGNGGRCIAAFAKLLGIVGNEMEFLASDGSHKAIVKASGKFEDTVKLSLNDVTGIHKETNYYVIDTGSPHYVEFVSNVAEMDVFNEGKKTRYSYKFAKEGINVNFVEVGDDHIFVRTYERGVEAETLSCGTGVTASAIAYFLHSGVKEVKVHTTGGDFKVSFTHNLHNKMDNFTGIWLTGPAVCIYKGVLNI